MTLEEYTTRIDEMISNPDTAAAIAADIKAGLTEDLATKDSLEQGISDRDARIKDLQETNIKLYMSIGKNPDELEKETESTKIPEDIGQARADAIAAQFGTSYFEDKYINNDKKKGEN